MADIGDNKNQLIMPCYWGWITKWRTWFLEKIKQLFAQYTPNFKGIVSNFNNMILCHESEDINKKSLFPKFQLIPILRFQVMYDYVWVIAPIDYCVK